MRAMTRGWPIATISVLAASAATAQPVPVPRQKPVQTEVSAPTPIPRQKPQATPEGTAPPGGADATAPPMPWSDADVAAARGACDSMLKGLAIVYRPHESLGSPQGCGAPAPVDVSQVNGVDLKPPAILTCTMARQLFQWVSQSVQPEARARLGTEVTTIHTAASYVCRGRNNQSGGKLSEHGKANALDMSGFSFASTKDATVGDGWGDGLVVEVSSKGSFLEAIRLAACTQFTTVLGPGSDSYHGDHFHVDALQRKNDYRICQ